LDAVEQPSKPRAVMMNLEGRNRQQETHRQFRSQLDDLSHAALRIQTTAEEMQRMMLGGRSTLAETLCLMRFPILPPFFSGISRRMKSLRSPVLESWRKVPF
jgi:hypothetical protein